MRKFWILTLILFCQLSYSAEVDRVLAKAQWSEIPLYMLSSRGVSVYMNYASSEVQNPEVATLMAKGKVLKSVDLIFSMYPKQPENWIRNYDSLLHARIKMAMSLDSSASDSTVQWNIIRQTSCNSDDEARALFHGLVFYYEEMDMVSSQVDTNAWVIAKNTVENILNGIEKPADSIVLEVLKRNSFSDLLLVTDWTGSMYPYGAQVLRWQKLMHDQNLVKGYVFFNDGNRIPDRRKRIGGTGGVFFTKQDSLINIQKLMVVVSKLGCGGDVQENNLEAVWKGMRVCKGWKEILMIADNTAPVRDMVLLHRITVPMHIILCGVTDSTFIHPNYLEIVRQTRGIIHLINEDIRDLHQWKEGEIKRIHGNSYQLKKGKIVLRR